LKSTDNSPHPQEVVPVVEVDEVVIGDLPEVVVEDVEKDEDVVDHEVVLVPEAVHDPLNLKVSTLPMTRLSLL